MTDPIPPRHPQRPRIPRKHQPKGFDILYEDNYLIVGNKAAGYLTVGAAWERERTIQHALDVYVRKGSAVSHRCVYVVHRLDQHTSGVLVFAKTERVQQALKSSWKDTQKTYYAVVHGQLAEPEGIIESFLVEDEDYVMHSTGKAGEGKLARTAYRVIKATPRMTLVKIDLLTGRKNQIRVQFGELGHPVVGDAKYGKPDTGHRRLALHSAQLSFTHPVTRQRLTFEVPVPEYFATLVGAYKK
jgi:RluA family pseudouridine synthase